MTRFATAWERPARKVLPRSLLGRSLLIILVPLIVVQAVALLIFYGSHLDLISRRLSGAVAGEIAQTIRLLDRAETPADRAWLLHNAQNDFDMHMRIEQGAKLATRSRINILGPMDDDLAIALRERVGRPYTMDWTGDPQSVLIDVQLPGEVLHVEAPRKRLYTSMIYVYVLWLGGSSVLLFTIAALFMAQPGARDPQAVRGGRGFWIGAGHRRHTAGGRQRGAARGHRVQQDAGAHQALSQSANGDAGRRQPRSAHTTHSPEAGTRHAAKLWPLRCRCGRDDGGRGGDGAHDQRLPRVRTR